MSLSRRGLFRFFLASGLTVLPACNRSSRVFNETIAVFGTLVRISLYAETQEQATQAFAALNARFQQIHNDWHAWEKGGLVSKINDAISEGRPIAINSEVANFIKRNQILCQQSNGLFDPGIGKLIKLWGFHKNSYDANKKPDQQDVQALVEQHASILNILWDGNILFCNNPAVSLDFGASGKAYALNAATETLKQNGIINATIAIGGDVQVLGQKPEGLWRIGINDPLHAGATKATLTLNDGEAACSSGTYERFYTDLGKKISHIIHPVTGQPVTHILHSTAIHQDSLIAEVAALAQLIAEEAQWHNIAQQLGVQYSYLITAEGKDITSLALAKRLKH
jgi:thiamine biosynthesis lipoprotein